MKTFQKSLLMIAPLLAFQAHAEEQWQFQITPYIWGVSQQGDIGQTDVPLVGDMVVELDMSFSDIAERLDSAALIAFKASKGDWVIWTDYIYMKLVDDLSMTIGNSGLTIANTDITARETFWDLDVGYRLINNADYDFYLYGGIRQVDIDTVASIQFQGPGQNAQRVSIGDDWLDPLIGVISNWQFAEKWSLIGQLELGGFGVGSDSSFQLALTANQTLSDSWSMRYALRYVDVDYDDNGFVFDTKTTGPLIGVSYSF